MTDDEVKTVVRATVNEMFLALGVDNTDSEAMLQMQADFRHIRRWREATEALPRITFKAAMTAIATGLVGWALVAFGWKH